MTPIAINIRGTSGTGKSTLVREIMSSYCPEPATITRPGRRRPIATVHTHPKLLHNPLAILGHYEAPCGGCDTITELDDVFALVRTYLEAGADVLFEGLILSGEIARTVALAKEVPLFVYALTTPVDQCVENINRRRRARGQMEPVRPKNTIAKARCVELTMPRLEPAECLWADYEETLRQVREKLRV